MRSVGGARVGLAACLLLGCASAWKPPPEPPPSAAVADTPSKYNPFRGLEWDANTRTIGCGDIDAQVSAELAGLVRMNGANELVIVPPGSPPGDALMARVHDPVEEPLPSDRDRGPLGIFGWALEQGADQATLGREGLAMLRLYAMARGQSLEEVAREVESNGRNDDAVELNLKGHFVEITYDSLGETWRLFGVDGGKCSVMVVERVRPDGTHHFTEIEKHLRTIAAAHADADRAASQKFKLEHGLPLSRDYD